jgi:SagB-type dehydrogenase family enzyme
MPKPVEVDAIESFQRDLFSVGELFHENTKLRRVGKDWILSARGPAQPGELVYAEAHPYKAYRCAPALPLPRGQQPLDVPLEAALRARRSVRRYAPRALDLAELARLLELSYGCTGTVLSPDGEAHPRRPAAAAGGLYSNELYVVALRVAGVAEGVYHYQPRDHSLECLRAGAVAAEMASGVLYPEIVAGAAAVLLLAGIFQRTRYKYGERGYRFALLDAGHLSQNLQLTATALDLGAVAIGGFIDDDLNRMLELDGVNEAVLLAIAVGALP